jgi:hypothetical protein
LFYLQESEVVELVIGVEVERLWSGTAVDVNGTIIFRENKMAAEHLENGQLSEWRLYTEVDLLAR